MKTATKRAPRATELLRQVLAKVEAIDARLSAPISPVPAPIAEPTKPKIADIFAAATILPLRPRMVAIGAAGEQMQKPGNHVAVLLPDYGLMFDVGAPKRASSWAEAKKLGAACNLLGFKDWQLASDEELALLVRRDKASPAIDTEFFPNTPTNDWFWTRTEYKASSSDCAWLVYFGNGDVSCSNQDYAGFVRACRRVPARQS